VEFYIADLMRVVTDIVNSSKGEKPDWKRLEAKGEDLKVLARAAQKAERDGNPDENPGQ